jgi:hypothetical protein
LNNEKGILALAIDLLVEEIKDENSTLMRAGESRIHMLHGAMKDTNATLKDPEAFSRKYDFDRPITKGKGKRIWDRVKFSTELKSVDALRGKITRHNTTINLLLTSAGK